MTISRSSQFSLLLTLTLAFSGCTVMDDWKARLAETKEKRAREEIRLQAAAEHAAFRAKPGWQRDTYRNETLLSQATAKNSRIEIGLKEQRGLLLVRDGIALDFPVATGRRSHPTPPGEYSVINKKKDYRSNLYGKIFDAEGKVVNSDADTRSDAIPEGGRFQGASMPYWMRLTNTGLGLHIGYVPGGRGASHGCIRLRRQTAGFLFNLVEPGTPVVIARVAPALETSDTR